MCRRTGDDRRVGERRRHHRSDSEFACTAKRVRLQEREVTTIYFDDVAFARLRETMRQVAIAQKAAAIHFEQIRRFQELHAGTVREAVETVSRAIDSKGLSLTLERLGNVATPVNKQLMNAEVAKASQQLAIAAASRQHAAPICYAPSPDRQRRLADLERRIDQLERKESAAPNRGSSSPRGPGKQRRIGFLADRSEDD